ncbi:MAG: tRNA (adenosine(37)-N6)-threonylcarbamoyltransferase complex ATPase subunit type 1 TsaE [Acidimicrobiia bacterium]|nr:tRNA (adenosine(37)-N6)-threonylcarbamoyltransferase complex ATPase subunit type 1 TsaE [Acidimicrobiia bacterium]
MMGRMVELESASVADTLSAGRRLAGLLQPGDVVLLNGRLGSGKTVLASGVAEGLGIDGPIPSPSFLLVRTYRGFLPLIHADAYRLGSAAEFEDLDVYEQGRSGVLVVEWGEAIAAAVGEDRLEILMEITGEDQRKISFVPKGSWQSRPLQELVA